MVRSILIVKLSSLGDVVHTLPAAQALRRRFPQARLAWAVERAHAGVLRGQPFLDDVIEWDRGTWRSLVRFVRRLRAEPWDLAIDFQGLLRSALIMRAVGARRRIGFAPGRELSHLLYDERVPTPQEPLHAVEKSLRLIEPLGAALPGLPLVRNYLPVAASRAAVGSSGSAMLAPIQAPPSKPAAARDAETIRPFPLPIADADRQAVDTWLRKQRFDAARERLVILNPHCRKEANIWPAERFAALAERLLAHDDLRVALTGGPIARELCQAIAARHGDRLWRADGRFSLLGSAELIRRAAVFVTGDTGPMHLAAAVDTPIVALFGPADPLKTGPYAADAVVLTKRLPCAPCFARHCPLGHDPPQCMADITVDEVYGAVLAQLRRSGDARQGDAGGAWRRSA